MEFTISGIQAAAKKQFETFSSLRPSGVVTLAHDPENAYDPYAVAVLYETETQIVQLGFIPGQKKDGKYIGSEIQRHIIDNEITSLPIVGYSYMDDGGNFNDEHRGMLGSVTLSLNTGEEEASGGRVVGGKYQRVTSFISYFDSYGGGDGLIKWAFEQVVMVLKTLSAQEIVELLLKKNSLYDIYKVALAKTADNGTMMHAAIEAVLSGKETFACPDGLSVAPTPDHEQTGEYEASEWLPEGWENFIAKYEIDVCYMEQRFFDNRLMVTGQPDLVCYLRKRGSDDPFLLTVVDWKSSKKPSMKHKIQISIYACNAQWDGAQVDQAMVVAFGAETKQKFSASVVKRSQIESNYQGMVYLRKCMDACGCYITKYWEG